MSQISDEAIEHDDVHGELPLITVDEAIEILFNRKKDKPAAIALSDRRE
jgi:hypothetical protein